MEDQEDTLWIRRIKQGDTNVFSHVVNKYQQMVFTIALRILEEREEAEDAAQEIFVKCFRSLKKFNGQSAFSTWLYKIAVNHAIDVLRGKKGNIYKIEPGDLQGERTIASENTFEKDIDLKSVKGVLKEAIDNLPPAERIMILLYYYEELSVGRIAAIFGVKENNMKVKLHRIRLKLLDLLRSKSEMISVLNLYS